jgi:hypothetical protein
MAQPNSAAAFISFFDRYLARFVFWTLALIFAAFVVADFSKYEEAQFIFRRLSDLETAIVLNLQRIFPSLASEPTEEPARIEIVYNDITSEIAELKSEAIELLANITERNEEQRQIENALSELSEKLDEIFAAPRLTFSEEAKRTIARIAEISERGNIDAALGVSIRTLCEAIRKARPIDAEVRRDENGVVFDFHFPYFVQKLAFPSGWRLETGKVDLALLLKGQTVWKKEDVNLEEVELERPVLCDAVLVSGALPAEALDLGIIEPPRLIV